MTSQNQPWIVVPLFRPAVDVPARLRRLAEQAPVVAVDDGSPRSYDQVLDELAALAGVNLLRSVRNRGIAAALNMGTSFALSQGASLVVFFDQDSCPASQYVVQALHTLTEFGSGSRIGALGPWDANSPGAGPPPGTAFVGRASVIQSGMAVPAPVFHAMGRFDESLFIDGVDTDFCLRLRGAGYLVGVSPDLLMQHRLGVGSDLFEQVKLGPFRATATFHSAERRYYINRNLIHLLRRFARTEPRWAVAACRTVMSNNLAALVLEEDRRGKVLALFQGLWDGVCCRVGPRFGPK